jgi:hypothetical protein
MAAGFMIRVLDEDAPTEQGRRYVLDMVTGVRHEVTAFTEEGDDTARLRQLQEIVGGLIEAIPSSEDVTIWVNEEGKLLGLPRNRLAEMVWAQCDAWGCLAAGDWISGNAIVLGGADDEGYSTTAPEWAWDLLAVERPA